MCCALMADLNRIRNFFAWKNWKARNGAGLTEAKWVVSSDSTEQHGASYLDKKDGSHFRESELQSLKRLTENK